MTGEGERSIATVLRDIVGNVQQIIQSEVRLARVEVRDEVVKARRSVVLLLVGGAVSVLALGLVLLAGVFALSIVVAPWLAAVIVGTAAAVVGAVVVSAGMNQMQQVSIPPPKTLAAFEENLQWTKAPVK